MRMHIRFKHFSPDTLSDVFFFLTLQNPGLDALENVASALEKTILKEQYNTVIPFSGYRYKLCLSCGEEGWGTLGGFRWRVLTWKQHLKDCLLEKGTLLHCWWECKIDTATL